jgi:LysR family transcriptional regulator, hca operon transcriptional activator
MELRHLRYFIAVAEAGSLLSAARELNTSQPSLSRQIRDLEAEVGVPLLERQPRGVMLTAAGKVFLDYARRALAEVEAAPQAARQIGQADRPVFRLGFLASREPWLPHILRVIREEAPGIEITLSSNSSPELGLALKRGDLDAAILRREEQIPGLHFQFMCEEPLIAMLAADHRLTAHKTIKPTDLASEVYVGSAKAAPVLARILEAYAERNEVRIESKFEAGSLAAAISLVVSTQGITLIPLYARRLLTPNVVAMPLDGVPPSMDLYIGYSEANNSRTLQRFLQRGAELAESFQSSDIGWRRAYAEWQQAGPPFASNDLDGKPPSGSFRRVVSAMNGRPLSAPSLRR